MAEMITCQLPSGRVVRAKRLGPISGGSAPVSYAGMRPKDARLLSHEDILAIEAETKAADPHPEEME